MSRYVKISTIGAPSLPENSFLLPEDVWAYAERILKEQVSQVLPDCPDLIVLPEMCDMPLWYTMKQRDDYINSRGDRNVDFFSGLAKENRCNIAFSTVRKASSDYYLNTLYMLDRDGNIAGTYDKNHLYIGEYTQNTRCGTDESVITLDIGNAGCVICYELNIDELRLRYQNAKPDILIFSSLFHGGLLQQIWAQSCRAYFVSSIAHSRPSCIISPLGEILAYTTNYTNHVTATVNFDYALAHLDSHENKLRALKKEFGPEVMIHDPGNLGYVMITSESDIVSAEMMLKQYNIMPLDEYIQLSLELRNDPKHQKEAGD